MKNYLADEIHVKKNEPSNAEIGLSETITKCLRAGLGPTENMLLQATSKATELTPDEAQFSQETWSNKPLFIGCPIDPAKPFRTELSSDEWLRLDALDRAINLLQEKCQSFTNPNWDPILRCAEDFYRFLSQ